MSDPFIGEVRIFPYNFAPRGWAWCQGQLLSIAQNTALFALLGTTFGGNGQTTFGLPDLRGRVPLGAGQGPGLSSYFQGQAGGTETVTLNVNQIASHGHLVAASSVNSNTNRPGNAFPAAGGAYQSTSDGTSMNPAMVQPAGGSQPHTNIQPFLALNFCIALEGIFPSRN